jgi:hypothetical protein
MFKSSFKYFYIRSGRGGKQGHCPDFIMFYKLLSQMALTILWIRMYDSVWDSHKHTSNWYGFECIGIWVFTSTWGTVYYFPSGEQIMHTWCLFTYYLTDLGLLGVQKKLLKWCWGNRLQNLKWKVLVCNFMASGSFEPLHSGHVDDSIR